MLKVLKFGGTSVGTLDRIANVAQIIKKIRDDGTRFGGAPDASGVIDHLDEAEAAVTSAPGTEFQI